MRTLLLDRTEMPLHIRAFLRSVGAGTLVGGGFWSFLALVLSPAVIADGEIGVAVLLVGFPILFAGCMTLLGMVIIGLPITALLATLSAESPGAYLLAGGVAGAALCPLVTWLVWGWVELGYFLALFGALAGGAAGNVWGGWRAGFDCEADIRFGSELF